MCGMLTAFYSLVNFSSMVTGLPRSLKTMGKIHTLQNLIQQSCQTQICIKSPVVLLLNVYNCNFRYN